jgi:hypothetical protein
MLHVHRTGRLADQEIQVLLSTELAMLPAGHQIMERLRVRHLATSSSWQARWRHQKTERALAVAPLQQLISQALCAELMRSRGYITCWQPCPSSMGKGLLHVCMMPITSREPPCHNAGKAVQLHDCSCRPCATALCQLAPLQCCGRRCN